MPLTESLWALSPESAQLVLTELANHLRPTLTGPAPAAAATAGSGDAGESLYTVQGGVAVIPINGPIARQTQYSWWSGRVVAQGQDRIAAALGQALEDRSVRAILFTINSPGGIVPGTKELADRIAEVSTKPMAAYADGLMASAAMWLGAATGRVLAPVTATVGSIGVVMVHADYSKLNEQWGIAYSYITGGRLKAAGNEDHPLSEEARALFQRQVSQIHDVFKADVIRSLGITAPPEQWAEGQTMLAGDAKTVGLVTHIVRDLDAAIMLLREEVHMDYQTFAARHPDLLAEIETKARAGALAEAEAKAAQAADEARERLLALVKAVAGEEAGAKVARLLEADISPAQLEAVAGALAPTAGAEGLDAKEAILQGLKAVTPPAVPGTPPAATNQSKLVADAERRAARG